MTEKRKSVLIKPEAHETLRKLAELSGQDLSFVLEEWLKACQLVLDSYGCDFSRISLMSTFYEKDRLAISYIAPVYTGQIRIPECLSERAKEEIPEKIMKLDIAEKMRKRKGGCPQTEDSMSYRLSETLDKPKKKVVKAE